MRDDTSVRALPCEPMIWRLLYAFSFLFAPHGAQAIHLLAPPTVEPAAIGEALVRWKIDSPAGGKVRYGLAEDKLDRTASDGVGTEHEVTLRGLQPGLRYFFSVGTARNPLTTGSFIRGQAGRGAGQGAHGAAEERAHAPGSGGNKTPATVDRRAKDDRARSAGDAAYMGDSFVTAGSLQPARRRLWREVPG